MDLDRLLSTTATLDRKPDSVKTSSKIPSFQLMSKDRRWTLSRLSCTSSRLVATRVIHPHFNLHTTTNSLTLLRYTHHDHNNNSHTDAGSGFYRKQLGRPKAEHVQHLTRSQTWDGRPTRIDGKSGYCAEIDLEQLLQPPVLQLQPGQPLPKSSPGFCF
jgi:hypothetical protein